jgi:hypothetical protein
MSYFYKYADGRIATKNGKEEAYQIWVKQNGAKVKKRIRNISILFGVVMAIQMINLILNIL